MPASRFEARGCVVNIPNDFQGDFTISEPTYSMVVYVLK